MNSSSERVASIGENSTSSQYCARLGDRRASLALHVLARGLELVLDVDVAGGDEGVDARPLGVLDRVPGGVDVLRVRARQAADDRSVHLARDRLHRLEVARRGDREAGLDDVHAEPRELVRDLELLLPVERDPRRLLAVAQGRVEDLYAVLLGAVHVVPNSFLRPSCTPLDLRQSAAATRYSPRRGRRRRSRRAAGNDMPSKRTHSRKRAWGRFAGVTTPMSSPRYVDRAAPSWVRALLTALFACASVYAVLLVGGAELLGLPVDPNSWWPIGVLNIAAGSRASRGPRTGVASGSPGRCSVSASSAPEPASSSGRRSTRARRRRRTRRWPTHSGCPTTSSSSQRSWRS